MPGSGHARPVDEARAESAGRDRLHLRRSQPSGGPGRLARAADPRVPPPAPPAARPGAPEHDPPRGSWSRLTDRGRPPRPPVTGTLVASPFGAAGAAATTRPRCPRVGGWTCPRMGAASGGLPSAISRGRRFGPGGEDEPGRSRPRRGRSVHSPGTTIGPGSASGRSPAGALPAPGARERARTGSGRPACRSHPAAATPARRRTHPITGQR